MDLVYEQEESPVVYVYADELRKAEYKTVADHLGCVAEWEGEDVFHLHVRHVRNQGRSKARCTFLRVESGEELLSEQYPALVFDPGSGEFVMQYSDDGPPPPFKHGTSFSGELDPQHDFVVRYRIDGEEVSARCLDFKEWNVSKKPVEVGVKVVPGRKELYSRSKGLLEVDALAQKRVMIVGLGSFGSQIAVELAKAGIGNFSLLDFDRVELHNLARHTCTVRDLGRLKTDAIKEAVLGKNPYANVETFAVDINKNLGLLDQQVAKADLVICATDNNASRFNLGDALIRNNKTAIFGRAITRAEGGDVFVYRPTEACYTCLIGGDWYNAQAEEISSLQAGRRSEQIAAYVSDNDAQAVIQVGLSCDIEPICNLMVKLSLVELSRGLETGLSGLEDELVFNYYIWANRRERHYANWGPFPNAGKMPTILRWYGAKVQKEETCPACGCAAPELDLGEDMDGLIAGLGIELQ